jgi:hypothetical protein
MKDFDRNNKYNTTRIYRLICNLTGKIFIGGCCHTLKKEIQSLKAKKKRFDYGIEESQAEWFEILQNKHYEISLIAKYALDTENDLFLKVNKHIKRYLKKGFTVINIVDDKIDNKIEDFKFSDDLLNFIAFNCRIKKNCRTSSKELYEKYLHYCNSNNLNTISHCIFSKRLFEKGYVPKRVSEGMIYTNIEIK